MDLSTTSLTSIGSYAFNECKGLTSITFPALLTSIGMSAFEDCEELTSITFPASLTSVGYRALYGCDALASLTVDESNPVYVSRNNVLYTKDQSTLLIYPAGVGDSAIDIPPSVTAVDLYAFDDAPRSAVYCRPQQPPITNYQAFFPDKTLKEAVLYVPVGTKDTYMQADPWRSFRNIEETDFAMVGINGVAAQMVPSVTVRGGAIAVEGAAATDVVEVFTADGRCAYRGEPTIISHLPGGVYLVRVGKFVQKVAL